MSAIDWAYLGSVGGEGIEGFAAACLRQRYPDALQTRAAQGDGGIDVYRDTPEGLVVWQIKKFTTPLTPSQKQQVKKSWKRFWDTHVAPGKKTIAHYYLATPWTPTDAMQEWFKTEVVAEASFRCQWDGAAFFDGLSADYPATFDRFFKGPDVLDNLVLAKATLAGLPIEAGSTVSMLEAARRREGAVRDIRDLASDTYFINSGTVSTNDGSLPLPSPNDAGVFFRYESLGNNRFHVESVVAKTAQSTELDPIRLELSFQVESGSEEAQKVQDWQAWGIPFSDVPVETRQVGGPLHEESPSSGLISFVLPPNPHSYPDMELRATAPDGPLQGRLLLRTEEVTRGATGGGLRMVAVSPSGVFRLEVRLGSELQPDDSQMTLVLPVGKEPGQVRDDLTILNSIEPADTFELSVDGGAVLAKGTGLSGASLAEVILPIAAGLAELQGSSINAFMMPDVSEVTVAQLEHFERLVDIYRGNAFTTKWSRLVLTLNEGGEFDPAPLEQGYFLRMVEQPTFRLGSREYQVTKRLARTYTNPTLSADIDPSALIGDDEIELEPGDDDRLVVAMLVDDNIAGTA
jgi:hypothetical protein